MQQENIDRNFGFILHDVARLLRVIFDRRVKKLDLTRSQWWVLTHLFRNDGITQSELADWLEVEKPTLGRLIDRLETNGWVRREGDPVDRRAKRIYLTDEIRPSMREMRGLAAGVRADALHGLNPEEQEVFVDTLLKVKANLLGVDTTSSESTSGALEADENDLVQEAQS